MALSQAEKTKVIFLLGYPGKVLDEGSTHYDPTIARRFDALTPEVEGIVRDVVAQIEQVKARLLASQGRMLVKRVGDIELNTDENSGLRVDQGRLLRELASLLDIPNLTRSGSIGMVGLCV